MPDNPADRQHQRPLLHGIAGDDAQAAGEQIAAGTAWPSASGSTASKKSRTRLAHVPAQDPVTQQSGRAVRTRVLGGSVDRPAACFDVKRHIHIIFASCFGIMLQEPSDSEETLWTRRAPDQVDQHDRIRRDPRHHAAVRHSGVDQYLRPQLTTGEALSNPDSAATAWVAQGRASRRWRVRRSSFCASIAGRRRSSQTCRARARPTALILRGGLRRGGVSH